MYLRRRENFDPMSYAGDISCLECWRLLREEPTAQLVDVRTSPEWNFVGVPVLAGLGREPILIEWQRYPDMAVNPEFADTLERELAARGAGRDSQVFFLCRSGARSQAAAAALASRGFLQSYNVAGGFEGARDDDGHRGTVEGWKHDGLPWMQR
jgi:rhodanese-related sulfurtransferase